jgi:hypothetical protein
MIIPQQQHLRMESGSDGEKVAVFIEVLQMTQALFIIRQKE